MYNLQRELEKLELREDQALVRYVLELVKLHEEQCFVLDGHSDITSQLDS